MKTKRFNHHKKHREKTLAAALFIACGLGPAPSAAFYESKTIDASGLIRGFAHTSQFPNDDKLYPDQNASGAAAIVRLMVDGDIGEHWRIEFNAYQTYIPSDLATEQSSAGLPSNIERSSAFETNLSESNHAQLVLDRLALRWSKPNVDITLGRQAINLATTFYFSPNDFFAPFSAQTFYRVYKPGVDALRAEIALGELSQISLITVLGYAQNGTNNDIWDKHPDTQRTTYLAHGSTTFGYFETSLIMGQVADKKILGVAAQGELFEWLGLRFEGHHAKTTNSDQQFSLGLEHRWENSLSLQWEWFYNGLGSDQVSTYANGPYLARRYTALGGSYDITALLSGQAVIISNLDDHSQLLSLNSLYSLSDEAELVLNLALPIGAKPKQGQLNSEFGAYPLSANVEVRFYF